MQALLLVLPTIHTSIMSLFTEHKRFRYLMFSRRQVIEMEIRILVHTSFIRGMLASIALPVLEENPVLKMACIRVGSPMV